MGTALLSFDKEFKNERLERSVWYMGGLITIHADSADTGGAFSLFEASGRSGGEPPLHVHENEDELFYVIEGRLVVTRGDEQLVLQPGDTGYLPRRVPHTFRIVSDQARMLVYVTPAGFEEYFRTLGRPAEQLTPDPNPPVPNYAKLASVAAKFGVKFLK